MTPRILPVIITSLAVCAAATFAQEKPASEVGKPGYSETEPTAVKRVALPWDAMDLGTFHTGTFKVRDQLTAKGIAIKVGTAEAPATVLFDPELLRVSAAWTGGFLTFPRARGGLEGQIAPDGEVKFATPYLPGWSTGEFTDDPRNKHQGHLAVEVAKYRGLYVHGDKVVLGYTVGKTAVLEMPGAEVQDGATVFTRTIRLEAGPAVNLLVAVAPAPVSDPAPAEANKLPDDGRSEATVDPMPPGATLETTDGKSVLRLPARTAAVTFRVALASANAASPMADLTALTKGGAARWGAPIETKGRLGTGQGAYVVDEITQPDKNPFNSWLRFGGHDFFPNGDAAIVSMSGDVWIVSGLDETLASVKWKRIATGLFQPLGCKIVDGRIYVTCRDQITRLHDLNGDGEADFYECFNNDCAVTDNYHEFALDLETDAAGNFYFAKGSPWTPTSMSPHQGTMLRVSKDGARLEVVATGLRAPNGLGMGPKDFLTCSDNQGHWMPANRLNVIKPGGFYGMVPAAHRTLRFKGADGVEFEANPSSAEDREKFQTEFWGKLDSPVPVAGYDLPLLWMPQSVDNSPGGEVWVSGGKWGPWEGRMLHLSYGKCLLYGVSMETVDGVMQGAVIRFPFKFPSGIMRGRFHPKDGQLYVCGLNVWQSDAAKFGCFSRVRYTGKPVTMPLEVHAKAGGIELKYSGALDPATAGDKDNYSLERWNYAWTGNYGSPDYKVSAPEQKGRDTMLVETATLSSDGTTVFLKLADMAPCMQMRIQSRIQAADGAEVNYEIHNTIHRLPGMKVAAP